MTFAKDDLIEALRVRYDHYSAQALFDMARERAGLADKPALDPSELRAWREGLVAVGDRVGSVLERIDDMLATAGHAPAKVEPGAKGGKAAAKAENAEPAKSEPTKAEAKFEPVKVDAKSEPVKAESTKADSKSGPVKADTDKADAKSNDKPIETTLVLTGVKAGEGEQVLVCGGTAALGDWDPARARPMTRTGDEWRVAVEAPAGSELAFKFLRRATDGKITWEDGDDRRAPAAPRIEAVWR